ncbi:hypothetical protein EVAR_17339_1 [Eumeta japonica]|uniref:Histone-lysine N-methyltransferase SETMAR n=1 Tax=Eumeta variegata TaxID=151549 RepID=A0A4C1SN81_EUMVA|nr:hypothetical protein EVAR_17339_1 [Eumeta japonica]
MVSVLQESAPSYTMVKNGLAYFNKDERAVKMILARASCDGTRGSRTKATWKLSRGVLFYKTMHLSTARVSRQALKDTGFWKLTTTYSPDLAPSDYFLFSNLKKELRGRRFVDDNQMKMAVESHFEGIFFGRFEGVIHQM